MGILPTTRLKLNTKEVKQGRNNLPLEDQPHFTQSLSTYNMVCDSRWSKYKSQNASQLVMQIVRLNDYKHLQQQTVKDELFRNYL